jgi:hypothetical protein
MDEPELTDEEIRQAQLSEEYKADIRTGRITSSK